MPPSSKNGDPGNVLARAKALQDSKKGKAAITATEEFDTFRVKQMVKQTTGEAQLKPGDKEARRDLLGAKSAEHCFTVYRKALNTMRWVLTEVEEKKMTQETPGFVPDAAAKAAALRELKRMVDEDLTLEPGKFSDNMEKLIELADTINAEAEASKARA